MKPIPDIIIIGGGAASLATTVFTARRAPAAQILILDAAPKLGAKILVSGGGRCNVTNRIVTHTDFPAPTAVDFFHKLRVTLHEEQDGKLFPDTNSATHVMLDAIFLTIYGTTGGWLANRLSVSAKARLDRLSAACLITAAIRPGLKTASR